MDQDIKKEFENISQKFTEEIGLLAIAVKEGFDHIETTMATKDELRQVAATMEAKTATLENKMDAGFSSVHSEIHSINEKLSRMDTKIDRLYRTETGDIEAVMLDVENIKRQMAVAGK